MADEDYEDIEALGGILELDEGWDREGWSEAKNPRYQRSYPRGWAPTRPATPIRGVQGGAVSGAGGRGQVRFAQPVATQKSVEGMSKDLTDAIRKVDQSRDRDAATLDKKFTALEASTKKAQQQAQQLMLLPLLLSKPPEITSLDFVLPGATPGSVGTRQTVTVENAKFKSDNSMFLLIMLMALGGMGSGTGSGGSSDNSMMLVMALALSGGFGSSTK